MRVVLASEFESGAVSGSEGAPSAGWGARPLTKSRAVPEGSQQKARSAPDAVRGVHFSVARLYTQRSER